MLKSVGLAPDGFRNITILGEIQEILGPYSGQNVHHGRDRCAWVAGEIVNNRVRPGPATVERDKSQHLVGHRPHRRNVLNLLLSDARILYDSRTHNFIGITDQNAARFAVAFHR